MKLLKAQAASLAGTLVDFATTFINVEIFGLWYVAATVTGNIGGGITNFYLGRNWVFHAQQKSVRGQMLRYILTWSGNLALNSIGVYLLTHFLGLHYIHSKMIASLIIGLSYNYFLQYYFVFK